MPAPNPRRFPASKLAILLNSFPALGQVVTAARIRKHLEQAGMQISGDGETIDILKYTSWLCHRRHSKLAKQKAERETPAKAGSFAAFAAKEMEDVDRVLGQLEK